jgi:hypothetical protein
MFCRFISLKSIQFALGGLAILTALSIGSFTNQYTQNGGPPVVEAHGSGWLDSGTTVRLLTNGDNVGIGTLNPRGKVEVVGRDHAQIIAGRPNDTTRVRLWAGTDGGALEATNAAAGAGLDFAVNGSIMAQIDDAGRLGVGTLNPQDRLEVAGNERAQISAGRPGDTTRVKLWAGTDGGVLEATNASAGAGLAFVVNGSANAIINDAGRLGVGTLNPQDRLEVAGNERAQISAGRPGDTTRVKLWAGTSGGVLEATNASAGAGLAFVVNGSANAIFNDAGRLGVGTVNPRDRLEVSGGNIRVSGGSFIDDGTTLRAPDYVFEEGYDLMSLEELDTYIDQEGHLPNVPSAEDIANHGLNLSQFQMKLLEKVEELTLYTLHQEKALRAQQRQIDELMTRLEAASK